MPGKDYDRWQQHADGSWTRRLSISGEVGVKATKGAIELAEEHDIDLTTVEGSGKDGQITKPDVEALIDG